MSRKSKCVRRSGSNEPEGSGIKALGMSSAMARHGGGAGQWHLSAGSDLYRHGNFYRI